MNPVGAGLKAEAPEPIAAAGSTHHVGEHIIAQPAEEKLAAGSAEEHTHTDSRKPIGRGSGKVSINICFEG